MSGPTPRPRPRPFQLGADSLVARGNLGSVPPRCAICDSSKAELIGIYSERGTSVDLLYCADCESFCSPDAPMQPVSDSISWHLKVKERNQGFSLDLLQKIGIDKPILLDIGCGIGTLIDTARTLGGGGVGYELNAACVNYGIDHGLDLRRELWDIGSVHPKPSLITCVMVLEHLHHPRDLLRDLVLASKKYDAPLYISVPWFNERWWHFLDEPVTPGVSHPLSNPAVHVSHFSYFGFEKVVRSFGAEELTLVRCGWPGFIVR